MLTGTRAFALILFGQVVSNVGSAMTGFALSVHVYKETRSVDAFVAIILAVFITNAVASPFAGVIVDRIPRKTAMMVGDIGAALATLSLFVVDRTVGLAVWHIVLATAWSTAFASLQWPAFMAATSALVPKEHVARASGIAQMGEALSMIASPFLAAVVLTKFGLASVFIIDFVTFGFAVTAVLFSIIPSPVRDAASTAARSVLGEIREGWNYLLQRPGLIGIMQFFMTVNFTVGGVQAIFGPTVMGYHGEKAYGLIATLGGIGMLIGSIAMGAWGGPKRKVEGLLWFGVAVGGFLTLFGLTTSLVLMIVGSVGMMFCFPFVQACSQSIWMVKVDPEYQGRVFSLRRLAATSLAPLSVWLCGLLATRVFEPAMMPTGGLASTAGRMIGVGEGSGLRLLSVIMGVLTVAAVVLLIRRRLVWNVEADLPDAVQLSVPGNLKVAEAAAES